MWSLKLKMTTQHLWSYFWFQNLLHALEELHQQQMEQLKKQRMAPIPLILEQQFSDKIPYADIPLVVPRAQGNHVDVQFEGSCEDNPV